MTRPKQNQMDLIGDASYDAVKKAFRDRGHRLQKLNDPDQGRDAQVVITLPSGETPGYHVGLQVKTVSGPEVKDFRAFKFTFDVPNIQFLADSTEPNYYVIHNPESGLIYWREAHEIVNFLDQCRPDWKEQKTVTLTVFTDNVLDAEAVDLICAEATAWATERADVAEDVKYITKVMLPLIYSKDVIAKQADKTYVWSGGSGIATVRSLYEFLQATAVTGNIQVGSYLCRVFNERAKAYFPPQHVMAEADTARSFRQLASDIRRVVDRHKEFVEHIPSIVSALSPQPLEGLDEASAHRPPGVVLPTDRDLSQSELVEAMEEELVKLGIRIERFPGTGADLVLDCDGARGLLALRLYKSKASGGDLDQIRADLGVADAIAGGIVIELCQIEHMQMNRRPRPVVEPTPRIPIGTTLPIVPDLIADLLDHAGRSPSWRNPLLVPTEEGGGLLHRMPSFLRRGTADSDEYQGQVARSCVGRLLGELRGGRSLDLTFHWESGEVEGTRVSSPTFLAALCLRGSSAYRDAGGSWMRSAPVPT